MTANELRKKYLDFFRTRGHSIVPSSSLVPENDATTLFTGSGMQPMVPYLLGAKHPEGSRIADSQKAFRAGDIEEVGDNRHTTFFEMLGNWSLGDYFKEEQIPWMYEFLTKEIGLDPKNLYFTCFGGNESLGIPRDTESAKLWQELLAKDGVVADIIENAETLGMQGGRVFYYGERKNWWSRAGVPQNMPEGEPGGADTEMFWDFGAHLQLHEASEWASEPCHVNCDCGRFMEIGNNVFMEYVKVEKGFEKLQNKNVDFGGGLERLLAARANNPDMFYIDVLHGLIKILETHSEGKSYESHPEHKKSFRVITDHMRAAIFLTADGVEPSNKDRGYILRRLLRRAMVHARNLELRQGWFEALVGEVVSLYTSAYPEFGQKQIEITNVLKKERVKFDATLHKGLKEFDKLIELNGHITGTDAFNLYQTFGFPWEVTHELVMKKGLNVEREEFEHEFNKHKDLSRTASSGEFKGGLANTGEKVVRLHTVTHLMQKALRQVLGDHVWQKGSNITEERTRFDFTHPEKVTLEQIAQVEKLVNTWLAQGLVVSQQNIPLTKARELGAIGLFGEKYADTVSVYTIINDSTQEVVSREFCGGPHVQNTSEVQGTFKILKEEAVSSGVRRIKAVLE